MVPCLSYLASLRRTDSGPALSVKTEEDWFKPENQQWVLEHRLASLVRDHIEATDGGKDTSFTVHELTMAHCDFVYWKGLWEVIKNAGSAPFVGQLEAIAQVV